MSLASHLLKHLMITKYCGVPWSKSTISRDSNGKPCFIPESGSTTIDFNVSHQAGIVSLIAAIGFEEKVEVGTDIVCPNERQKQDHAHIEKTGFFDWVNMHEAVFAETELNHMKLSPVAVDLCIQGGLLHGNAKDAISRCQRRNETLNIKVTQDNGFETIREVSSNEIIDAKVRRLYAMWCLREAYVKMTGEGLSAPWLKELEIADVVGPPGKEQVDADDSLEPGEVERVLKIYFKGRPVTDVKMELAALGSHYMVGGCFRMPKGTGQSGCVLGIWKKLGLEADVLAVAESNP